MGASDAGQTQYHEPFLNRRVQDKTNKMGVKNKRLMAARDHRFRLSRLAGGNG